MQHEVLVRNSKFLDEYKSDKPTQLIHKITALIYRSYKLKKLNLQTEMDFHIFESQGISGFYFNNHKYSAKELQFIQEFLKDTVCSLGYYVSLADVKITSNDFGLKKTERYYLKPNHQSNQEDKRIQKFGNITLEIHYFNENPDYFKFLAVPYLDNQFDQANTFDELIEALFD